MRLAPDRFTVRLQRGLLGLCALLLSAVAQAAPQRALYFVTQPFPAFTYAEQGKAAGPMVAVLQAVRAELGRSCRIEVMPWRRALDQAQRGEADGIFTVVDLPERRVHFQVSRPVLNARYTRFARSGEESLRLGADGLGPMNEAVALHLMRSEHLAGLQAVGVVQQFAYSFGLSRKRIDAAQARACDWALYKLCRSSRTAELVKPFELPASSCQRP